MVLDNYTTFRTHEDKRKWIEPDVKATPAHAKSVLIWMSLIGVDQRCQIMKGNSALPETSVMRVSQASKLPDTLGPNRFIWVKPR